MSSLSVRALRGGSRFNGVAKGIESSEIMELVSNGYMGHPLSTLTIHANTSYAGRIVRAKSMGVFKVPFAAHVTKVAPTVIGSIGKPVTSCRAYMVNILFRPFAKHVQECKAMRSVLATSNSDLNVTTAFVDHAGNLSCLGSAFQVSKPFKYPGNRVVANKLLQPLLGKFAGAVFHQVIMP